MRASDEDALFCDMVQYYGLLDYKSLPIHTQAVLAVGLPGDSRIMRKLSGQKVSTDTLLLAGILDQLRIQAWARTKNGRNHQGKPKSIMQALLEGKEKKEADVIAFRSGSDFERYRERLMRNV